MQFERLQLRGLESCAPVSPAAWGEAVLAELNLDPSAHTGHHREEDLVQKVPGRTAVIVRASAQIKHSGAIGAQQGRQHGLEHQGGTPGGADVEPILASADASGLKRELRRIDGCPFHSRATYFRSGSNGGQVLVPESGLGSIAANLRHPEGRARDQRKRERGPENLAATLAEAPVNFDELHAPV